jgi:hypothetical protein
MSKKQGPGLKGSSIKIQQAVDALEELNWLFQSKKGMALRHLPDLLRRQLEVSSDLDQIAGAYASPNPNKHFLIGVLPRLFQDQKLFPNNEDIADFAQTVLHVPITRYEKRSKYELIGFIVCQTNELSEEKLSSLVAALANITGSEEKLNMVIEARKARGFTWNEAIQKIGGQSLDDEGR